MKVSTIYTAIRILAAIGVLLAVYLIWQRNTDSTFEPCNINATVNCDAIISGEVSEVFGIPTPAIGLTGYLVILLGAFLKKPKLILPMAAFGLVFCLWIAYRELFELRVICPVCIACQVVMITVFGLSLVLFRKTKESVS